MHDNAILKGGALAKVVMPTARRWVFPLLSIDPAGDWAANDERISGYGA
jgi:hypothetical protein